MQRVRRKTRAQIAHTRTLFTVHYSKRFYKVQSNILIVPHAAASTRSSLHIIFLYEIYDFLARAHTHNVPHFEELKQQRKKRKKKIFFYRKSIIHLCDMRLRLVIIAFPLL